MSVNTLGENAVPPRTSPPTRFFTLCGGAPSRALGTDVAKAMAASFASLAMVTALATRTGRPVVGKAVADAHK